MTTAPLPALKARPLTGRLLPWVLGFLAALACALVLQVAQGAAVADAPAFDGEATEQVASMPAASCEAGIDGDKDTMDRDGVITATQRLPSELPRLGTHGVRSLHLQLQAPPLQRPPRAVA